MSRPQLPSSSHRSHWVFQGASGVWHNSPRRHPGMGPLASFSQGRSAAGGTQALMTALTAQHFLSLCSSLGLDQMLQSEELGCL